MNRFAERTTGWLTGAVGLLLAASFIAGGVMPGYASAPPEIPHYLSGSVSFNGDPVEEGILVEAFVDDVEAAWTTVDDDSIYSLGVPGTAGGTVTFEVGGVPANETAAWQSGKVQQLNLTIDEPPGPPVPRYALVMAADPVVGGSATDETGTSPYAAGAEVSIRAVANPGYGFVGWTANTTVTFGNATAAETTFTMPSESVIVTASFQEVPPPTVTTQAATDITSYSATLHMSYTVGNLSSVDVRFACKRCTDSAWFYSDWASRTMDGTYTEVLTGLASQTGYEFKAQLRNVTVIEGVISRFCTARGPGVSLGDLSCPVDIAAYETRTAERLHVLREFRDVVLLRSAAGSQFVALYYRVSPPVARFVAGRGLLSTLIRKLLVDPLISILDKNPLGQYTE